MDARQTTLTPKDSQPETPPIARKLKAELAMHKSYEDSVKRAKASEYGSPDDTIPDTWTPEDKKAIILFLRTVYPNCKMNFYQAGEHADLCIDIKKANGKYISRLSYKYWIADNFESFLRSFVTDIAMKHFIKDLELEQKIKPGNLPYISFDLDSLLGHKGLETFWDVATFKVDLEALNTWLLNIQAREKQAERAKAWQKKSPCEKGTAYLGALVNSIGNTLWTRPALPSAAPVTPNIFEPGTLAYPHQDAVEKLYRHFNLEPEPYKIHRTFKQ